MGTSGMQGNRFQHGALIWAFSLAVSVAGLGRRVSSLKH